MASTPHEGRDEPSAAGAVVHLPRTDHEPRYRHCSTSIVRCPSMTHRTPARDVPAIAEPAWPVRGRRSWTNREELHGGYSPSACPEYGRVWRAGRTKRLDSIWNWCELRDAAGVTRASPALNRHSVSTARLFCYKPEQGAAQTAERTDLIDETLRERHAMTGFGGCG